MRVVVVNYYKWLLPIFKHFCSCEIDVCEVKDPWSNSVIKHLQDIDENILLVLDDYIFKKVNWDVIEEADKLCKGDVGCVRVGAKNKRKEYLKGTLYPNDAPYSMNLQIAVWQPKKLLEILKENESPWQTEVEGSKRMAKNKMKILWIETGVEYAATGCMQKRKPLVEEFNWINKNW